MFTRGSPVTIAASRSGSCTYVARTVWRKKKNVNFRHLDQIFIVWNVELKSDFVYPLRRVAIARTTRFVFYLWFTLVSTLNTRSNRVYLYVRHGEVIHCGRADSVFASSVTRDRWRRVARLLFVLFFTGAFHTVCRVWNWSLRYDTNTVSRRSYRSSNRRKITSHERPPPPVVLSAFRVRPYCHGFPVVPRRYVRFCVISRSWVYGPTTVVWVLFYGFLRT